MVRLAPARLTSLAGAAQNPRLVQVFRFGFIAPGGAGRGA
jgi:hypothetical protein